MINYSQKSQVIMLQSIHLELDYDDTFLRNPLETITIDIGNLQDYQNQIRSGVESNLTEFIYNIAKRFVKNNLDSLVQDMLLTRLQMQKIIKLFEQTVDKDEHHLKNTDIISQLFEFSLKLENSNYSNLNVLLETNIIVNYKPIN